MNPEAGDRTLSRSPDRRVTVSWDPAEPVRLFIREPDGSAGDVDLRELTAMLVHIGVAAGPPPPGGVELGWLQASGSTRFIVDGHRLSVVAGLELLAAGILEALRAALRLQSPESDK